MKRTLILLLAAGLVCAFPATALAGKPDKPAPATVDVTITGNVATTCTGPITMDYSDKGNKHSVVVVAPRQQGITKNNTDKQRQINMAGNHCQRYGQRRG